ncbi:ERF family protein [Pyramidobacter piscolens]|uniref:ERF family protein n=1 Tax=Pyramidobacter piscolens TaxID=638849 RepID=UPI003AB8D7F3
MDSTESIKELATALSKMQGAMKCAVKDSSNPYFNSKYTTLAECWNTCREPMKENGLSLVQIPSVEVSERGALSVFLETVLAHSSGERISSTLRMPITKQDPQGVGSAITYARRYAMCAMLGIASDDDDGEAAVNHGAGDRGKAPPQSYRQQAAPRSADRKPEPRGTAQRPPEAKNAVQRPPAAKTPEEESRLKLVSAAKHLLTGDAGLGLKNEEVAPFVRRVLGREDIGDGLKSMPVADLEKIVEAASESLKGRM